MTLLARIGLAIVHPRWALTLAGDRRHAGRSGSDLLAVVALVLLATQLRGLFVSGWVAARVDSSLGLRAAGAVLTDALTIDFAFLVLGAVLVFAAAGPRREIGRAFDLACVATLPLLFVDLAITVVVRAVDADVPAPLAIVLSGLSYGWAGALLAVSAGVARVATTKTAEPPAPVAQLARRAGRGVLAVIAIGAIVQVQFIARHLDLLRPMTTGDDAPTLALPRVEADGALGAPVSLADQRGKVVVVDFWATWCRPCLESMPALDQVARAHAGDVVVLSINLDDPKAARAIFTDKHYAMTLLADDGETAERYGVTTIPHLVLVDRGGTVREVVRGGAGNLEARVGKLSK
jgi:thiol-disulfide isomerase/thioredoxin